MTKNYFLARTKTISPLAIYNIINNSWIEWNIMLKQLHIIYITYNNASLIIMHKLW